jgi:hypothetical protein
LHGGFVPGFFVDVVERAAFSFVFVVGAVAAFRPGVDFGSDRFLVGRSGQAGHLSQFSGFVSLLE